MATLRPGEVRVRRLVATAGAGFVATALMSVAMLGMKRRLPWYQRYPLPPRLITSRALQKLGVGLRARRKYGPALTVANHFAFGTTTGALYTPLTMLNVNPLVAGSLFGLAVWSASYLGWLPKAYILPSARFTPKKRSALMIAAHLVWGVSLATLANAASENHVDA